MTSKISLMISDENRLFREGLGRILVTRKMEIAGEARSLVDALDMLRTGTHVNLLLCDPSADTQREFEAMKEIAQEFPNLHILVLTDRTAPSWLDMAVEAGASGFLPKDISADALGFSLELVLLGEHVFPTLHSLLEPKAYAPLAPLSVPNEGQSRPATLSARETEILGCLVKGQPNKTIARNLNMAEATVKVHLKALLRKIKAGNRTQAAIWGMNNASQPSMRTTAIPLRDHNGESGMNSGEYKGI
ncbi:MAG: DNA-binding response regulator [Rhodospirillales bacterium]|nr:DNA-binding response regulator [Rhodospirillales bacterium]